MEIWIRSQDRLYLGKTDKLLVNGCDIFNQDQLMGTYTTYERALEVLDEIQRLLINYYQNIDYEIVPFYEMPEE